MDFSVFVEWRKVFLPCLDGNWWGCYCCCCVYLDPIHPSWYLCPSLFSLSGFPDDCHLGSFVSNDNKWNWRRAHPLLRMSFEPIRRRGLGPLLCRRLRHRPLRRRWDRLRQRRLLLGRRHNNSNSNNRDNNSSSKCSSSSNIFNRRRLCRWQRPPRQRWPTGRRRRAHRLPAEEAPLRRLANPNPRISNTEKRRRQPRRRWHASSERFWARHQHPSDPFSIVDDRLFSSSFIFRSYFYFLASLLICSGGLKHADLSPGSHFWLDCTLVILYFVLIQLDNQTQQWKKKKKKKLS